MSPEQSDGDGHVDGRTDVYSLGCVAYQMLTGEPPFTGPNTQARCSPGSGRCLRHPRSCSDLTCLGS